MNSFDPRYMYLKEEKLKQIINKKKTVVGVANDLHISRQTIHKWLSRYKRFGIVGLIERKRTGCKKAHNRTSAEVEQLVINMAHQYFTDGDDTLFDGYSEARVEIWASEANDTLSENRTLVTKLERGAEVQLLKRDGKGHYCQVRHNYTNTSSLNIKLGKKQ